VEILRIINYNDEISVLTTWSTYTSVFAIEKRQR